MKRFIALALLAVLGFAAGCGATKKIVVNTQTSALAGRIEKDSNSTITIDSSTPKRLANAYRGTRLTCKHWDGQTLRVPLRGSASLTQVEVGTTTSLELHVTRTAGGRVTASCKPSH